MSSRTSIATAAIALALASSPLDARVDAASLRAAGPRSPVGAALLTQEEALALAFPKCEVERKTVFLNDVQRKRIASVAKVDFEGSVVYPYVATAEDKLVGTAYFDAHRVRTKREVLMVVVSPDQKILRVEVLSFAEPKEYLPRNKWYEQFRGRKLDADLSLKRKIRGVTGATLTARSTTDSARRVLAIHQVLSEVAAKKVEDEKKKKKKGKQGQPGDPSPPRGPEVSG